MTALINRPVALDKPPALTSWHRLHYGDVPVDALNSGQVLEMLTDRMVSGLGGYVVTPNVDHLVHVRRDPSLCRIYQRAILSLPDGAPLVWLSKLLGQPVREKVSGSDLLLPLLRAAEKADVPVFILGSRVDVVNRAIAEATKVLPGLRIVGSASPKVHVDGDQQEVADALAAGHRAGARLVLVALGSPKQEIVMFRHGWRLPEATFVGVGASIDFLAGAVRRAPQWVSRAGLEWAYRLRQEPRRLWRRYLVDGPTVLPVLASMALRRLRGTSLISERATNSLEMLRGGDPREVARPLPPALPTQPQRLPNAGASAQPDRSRPKQSVR